MKTTIEGWIVRDNDDDFTFPHLWLFSSKPWRSFIYDGMWTGDRESFVLPDSAFPDLKWEDEPRKVTITIEEEEE